MRRYWLVLGLVGSMPAWAVPMTMTYSGRVLDASGQPVNGTHDVTVQLYDDAGVVAWGDTFQDVPVRDGYYAVVLGSGAPLATADLESDAISVGVRLDAGEELVNGLPLGSVPFAIRTEQTRNLVGGSVDATTIGASGGISGASLTTSGAVTSGSVSTGALVASDSVSAGSVSTDTLVASGAVEVGSLSTTGTIVADRIQAGVVEVNGLDFGGPVVGEWYPSVHRNSASGSYEFMTLDRQAFNTDPEQDYFAWNGSNTITFRQAGYYRVDMRTITYNTGYGNHVETWKNGARLHLSHYMYNAALSWRRHATSVVSHFAVGDTLQVRVYCNTTSAPHCYHQGPDYTALTVQLMR